MAAKAFFVLCAQAFLTQTAYCQCLEPLAATPALAYDGCDAVTSTCGGFAVTSASPIAPTGVSVVSENAIEGPLAVGGNLPLLGSVALEGAFPAAGAGDVSYGCGNGEVGMASESPITTGILALVDVGPAPVLGAGTSFATTRVGPAFSPAHAGPAFSSTCVGPAFSPTRAGPAFSPARVGPAFSSARVGPPFSSSLAGAANAPSLLDARGCFGTGLGRGCGSFHCSLLK